MTDPAAPRVRSAPRQGPRQDLWATAAVAAVLALVVLGGYVADPLLSEAEGPPVGVAGLVRVEPLSGWRVVRRSTEPPSVVLARGAATVVVIATWFDAGPTDLLGWYVDRVLRRGAVRLSLSAAVPVQGGGGLRGVTIDYVGVLDRVAAQVEGRVTALVSPDGVGIVFDASAPVGLLRFAWPDVEAMISGASVR